MKEQQTIFDENFNEDVSTRRRAIIPLTVKLYVWIGMLLGGTSFGYLLIENLNEFLGIVTIDSHSISWSYNVGSAIGLMIPSLLLFFMTFLLWIEVKWAIRFNWGVVAFNILIIMVAVLINGLSGILAIIPVMFFIPYWVLLYRIQKRWESTAVPGKQINHKMKRASQ
jgi:hypothetical protein